MLECRFRLHSNQAGGVETTVHDNENKFNPQRPRTNASADQRQDHKTESDARGDCQDRANSSNTSTANRCYCRRNPKSKGKDSKGKGDGVKCFSVISETSCEFSSEQAVRSPGVGGIVPAETNVRAPSLQTS